jgi:uncharacterized protein (TIRG00374 family)
VKRVVQGVLGIAIGAVCLWLAFRGVAETETHTGISWKKIGAHIASVPVWAHVAFVALMVAQCVIRTERWRVQARGLTGKAPAMRESLAINAAGFAAVFLLPFRLGELVRPNLCAQRGIMRQSSAMAVTVLERAIDGIVTTGFFGAVLFAMRDREIPDAVRAGGWVALLVFGGAIAAFVVMYRLKETSARLAEQILGRVHAGAARRIASMLRGFIDGLACFAKPTDLLAYVVLTVLYWLLNVGSMYVYMHGMGLDVPAEAPFFTLCFLVIGVMIPAPPGNVGNFHAFARAALTIFGVAAPAAVAYAILLHAASVVFIVAWALVFFASRDLSFSGVRKAAANEDAAS